MAVGRTRLPRAYSLIRRNPADPAWGSNDWEALDPHRTAQRRIQRRDARGFEAQATERAVVASRPPVRVGSNELSDDLELSSGTAVRSLCRSLDALLVCPRRSLTPPSFSQERVAGSIPISRSLDQPF